MKPRIKMNQPHRIESEREPSMSFTHKTKPSQTSIHPAPTQREENDSIDHGSDPSSSSASRSQPGIDPYESVPDVLDSTSVKSDDDDDDDYSDEEEDDDLFYPEAIPMPRLSSSTIPIVMEVVQPSNGRYTSTDPLFQGVCLYHYVSSSEKPATKSEAPKTEPSSREKQLTHSWFFPSIFQHLLDMQQQRVVE
jgi:hypothetical protein